MSEEKKWYSKENGKYNIELRVDHLEQLFDKRDPNPFRKKDLDDDVAEYIVSSAQEIGTKKIGKVIIVTKDTIHKETHETIIFAINDFFLYRSEMARKSMKNMYNLGFKTLLIGLFFLSSSIMLSNFINLNIGSKIISSFLNEGLVLMGWVSMWKPINIFLYEWWPIRDQKKLLEKLSAIDIAIITKERRKLKSVSILS